MKYHRGRSSFKWSNLTLKLLISILLFSVISITTANSTIAKESTNFSNDSTNRPTKNDNLLNQGKQLYERGNLVAAAKIWEQANQKYQDRGQTTNLIHSNNYLAAVYQDLGNWQQARQAIANNLALISPTSTAIARRQTRNPTIPDASLLYAQTLNTRGSWQLRQGQGESAYATWQETEAIYRQLKDPTGIILSKINQVQALQSLGFYRRSQKIIIQVKSQLNEIDHPELKIAAAHTLAGTLEISGDIQQAEKILQQSLSLAQKLNSRANIAQTYFKLGNLARLQTKNQQSIQYYQQAIDLTPHVQTRLEARLNQFSQLVASNKFPNARNLIPTIEAELNRFPPSRAAVYAQINYAQSLRELNNPTAEQILQATVRQAEDLGDKVAQAYALGELGAWYENKQNNRALQLTKQALFLAQTTNQTKIAANLHWQQGRILKQQGKLEQAIAVYELAVKDLDNLSQDLVAVNSDLKFSFRQQVEPVYRQLVELLLEDIDNLKPKLKQQHLEKSRQAIEALQQKELENFFRVACLDVNQQNIDSIDPQAATIYPILLDNSIEVILSLPGKPLQHYRTVIDTSQQEQTFDDLLQYLNPVFSTKHHLPQAQKLYDLLIRPAEAMLQQQEIKTLVFVLDGSLRSLPMSVLHDGQQYLIEKYHLALTPGLQLLPTKSLNSDRFQVMMGGLSKARHGFAALPGVKQEISNIKQIADSQTLLDERFTNTNLQQKVASQPAEIVHLATHGQFSSNAEDTYILTWNDRIRVNEFDRLLDRPQQNPPIELLVLSACRTAAGDKRAILGLAGMAIRSGARSTMATLWSVSDLSTAKLMTEFYHHLKQPNITKAQAMQQAQLALLHDQQYSHPYYWSPFVLIGNWQ